MKRGIFTFAVVNILLISFLLAPLGSSLTISTEKTTYENTSDDLPSYFSWRDINGTDFMTPIRNQIKYPSCESFALLGALEALVQIKVGYPFGCDLSEAHLFFFSGGNLDWGSYPENDTNYLVEYGVPDEACWPYPTDKQLYPKNTTCPDWQNRTVKIKNWSYLPNNVDAIKRDLIENGPVPTYLHVYQDFMYYLRGVYRHIWGESRAPHLVTIYGYDDELGCWLCKNSWGTKWGDNGWFKIKYGECSIEEMAIHLGEVYGNFPIVFVDDDNENGPWDGTQEQPYQHIQDAIDQTYEGYTIYVHNGTYNENIIINKTIKLDGENKTSTIINGNGVGDVVYIHKPNVRVSGFTIQNSGTNLFDAGIKTLSLNSNTTIKNNIIQNNDVGIHLNFAYEKSANFIESNIIQNNRNGIFSLWANNNQIQDNIIQNNTNHGIEMERSRTSTLTNNTIRGNGECGIYLRTASDQNIIKDANTLEENKIGIKLYYSNQDTITGNNFINNEQQAYFYHSFLNKWTGNYWNDWERILPRTIKGHITQWNIPWINFDFNPSNQIHT